MIQRIFAQQVRKKLEKFPAVALLGPRQSGKTTLAKALGGSYFDMELNGDQIRLDVEWENLSTGKELVIIDEAQEAPSVFRRLRNAIDSDRKRNGRFLLLGSVSPALLTEVSESLAGRLGMVRMTPLILPELDPSELDRLWLCGGYPDGGILDNEMFPEWQKDYLDLLTSRDFPAWGLSAKPKQTMRLMSMLAVTHGQPFNASKLGASLALDYKTVQSYCDFLEGVFLIRSLVPWSSNLKKRLVKTPRIFWRDSGLLHAIMNVHSMDQLYNQPWLGHSWEGFVIEQTLAALQAYGHTPGAFFFRSTDGFELDLLLDWGGELWAVEIKLTSNPSSENLTRLKKTADLVGASKRVLICRVPEIIENDSLHVVNLMNWLELLRKARFK